MPETQPRTIGRYELRRELGRGMMGVVYEAVDPELGRRVALKTIQIAFVLSPRERELFEQRFLTEARAAEKLSHPGIVTLHDVGRDPESGALYIALEYLEGRTLAEVIRTGVPLHWREALRITARIAEALHHAHAHGVIHRDIKPANIMLLPSGQPKIMDFGIAKTETARIKLTATGQFFGTPLYMAPEQAVGRKVDARADLFSLGSIAYTLLTGRQAFGAENITKIITRVVQEDPPPPCDVLPGLPADVDYLLERALAKDPASRYADGATLAEDIQDILEGQAPRHREGWTRPRRAEPRPGAPSANREEEILDLELVLLGTQAGRAPAQPPTDLEAQLATLVSAPPAGATLRPRSRPSRPAWRLALAALGAVCAAALLVRYLDPRSEAPTPGTAAPAPRVTPPSASVTIRQPVQAPSEPPEATPVESPSALPETGAGPSSPEPSSAPRVSPAPALTALLSINFEHPLKSGTLRVWVDHKLVVEQKLEGQASKKMVGLRIHKGRVEQTLRVRRGRHEVRVQVSWEDNQRTESLAGTFTAGSARHLEIRLGRLRKNLSLEWRDET